MVDVVTIRRQPSDPAPLPMGGPAAGRDSAVSFGDVTVREFEVVPSDNPSVRSGAGIELGWRYNLRHDRTPIDRYEAAKRPSTVGSRAMSMCRRHQRLRAFGYSYEDIYEASRHAEKQRKQRDRSVSRRRLDRLCEMKESVGTACKNICSTGAKGSGLWRMSSPGVR